MLKGFSSPLSDLPELWELLLSFWHWSLGSKSYRWQLKKAARSSSPSSEVCDWLSLSRVRSTHSIAQLLCSSCTVLLFPHIYREVPREDRFGADLAAGYESSCAMMTPSQINGGITTEQKSWEKSCGSIMGYLLGLWISSSQDSELFNNDFPRKSIR